MALCAMTLIIYIPWRAIDKYHNYLRMHADVPDFAVQRGFGRSLVLVRGERFPDYASEYVTAQSQLSADPPPPGTPMRGTSGLNP